MTEIKLTNEQKVTVTLKPKTSTGKSVSLDGKPTWQGISGDCTVSIAEDGLSADVISGDAPGMSQILIEADADLGAGVVTISEVLEVTVEGALASNLGVSVGTPVPK